MLNGIRDTKSNTRSGGGGAYYQNGTQREKGLLERGRKCENYGKKMRFFLIGLLNGLDRLLNTLFSSEK